MKTKIIYVLDKTNDKELEYANLFDAMIAVTNMAKSTGEMPNEFLEFEYEIVDDSETMTSEYRFTIETETADNLLDINEIKKALANFIRGI